jgi:hypothetical protein
MNKFSPEFDRVGVALAFAALLILLYFGLTVNTFFQDLWVAFAFWMIGFFGTVTLGLARLSKSLNLRQLFTIFVGTGLILVCFFGISTAYGMIPQDIFIAEKALGFGIGVSEELFFGVFLLSILINYLGLDRIISIVLSAGLHSAYHIPQWGINPLQLSLFFISFLVARSVYVFLFPKVGVLLGAHGFWNVAVT